MECPVDLLKVERDELGDSPLLFGIQQRVGERLCDLKFGALGSDSRSEILRLSNEQGSEAAQVQSALCSFWHGIHPCDRSAEGSASVLSSHLQFASYVLVHGLSA